MDVRTIFIGAGEQLVNIMAWGRGQACHSVTERAWQAHPQVHLLTRCAQCKFSGRIESWRGLGRTLTVGELWQGSVI